VDFSRAQKMVEEDLRQGFDLALHLGQDEMSSCVRLERVARNSGPSLDDRTKLTLVSDGPSELKTGLPLKKWNRALKDRGVPAVVSRDAGCFVCNAVFYWSLYYSQKYSLGTQSVFIHLPLAEIQVLGSPERLPTLDTETSADAVEIIIGKWVADALRRKDRPLLSDETLP
jgi:pyroglutamyl-peptidase